MKNKEIVKGITMSKLQNYLKTDMSEYGKAHRRAKRLDALDRNKLWEALCAKFPAYQLLPQTNDVSYIKNNILASIYTVGKSAQLLCTCEQDRDIIEQLNVALDHIWSTRNVAYYQLQAGERAALLNLGLTQVGWDNNIISGEQNKNFEKGQVKLKNIDPLKYYRDPYADSIENASHVVIWEDYHESVIESNPKYADAFRKYKDAKKAAHNTEEFHYLKDTASQTSVNKPGYHRIYTWWVRTGSNIAEIHVVDNDTVLWCTESIKPAMFPIAELYCNLPAGDVIGTSEPAKIMDNSIVYNIMQSIYATAEYKNQRPPRFISAGSGINVNAFVKHGNDADRTFVVQGDASKAVHYHQYPTPGSTGVQTMGMLKNDMQQITGVDGKYTGRDTGSVLTTGGVQTMLDQATLIDTTKILLYEQYAKRLSKLIILNYICNSSISRNYLVKNTNKVDTYDVVTVNFPQIPESIVFDYQIDISSEMPKNKARIAATADAMIEKQMQYQGAGVDVDLITPQEWLMLQDIPHKEYFLERMGIQRTQNWQQLVAQAVTQYAALVDQGVMPADAINATAQTMSAQQNVGQQPNMEEIAQNTQMF